MEVLNIPFLYKEKWDIYGPGDECREQIKITIL